MSENISLLKEVNNIANNMFWRSSYSSATTYIVSNLKDTYRPYQERALENLQILLNNENLDPEIRLPNELRDVNQLLFRMATGSGKTNIMAGAVLAFYREKNIQRFLFTTNLTSVLDKTKENFFNESSNKYLFNSPLIIDGENIQIVHVSEDDNFPEILPNTIYIKIVSIQKLLDQLDSNSIRENRTTLEELNTGNLGILVDEAHHFNRNATDTTITLQNETQKDINTFENTIDQIRETVSRKYTVYQLEFTATMPFGNKGKLKKLSDKYIDKMIFDYNLEDFIENDGYGKNLLQIETTLSDKDNMMMATLVSQFRKEYALEKGFIHFKPITLFKSSYINVSNESEIKYENYLRDLTVFDINYYLDKMENSDSDLLREAYKYYSKIEPENIISTLQSEFIGNSLNANNDKDPLLNFKLNTLEDRNNPYRNVFAVERVSEGWDVLNLYDIVRINEKAPKNHKTNGEAQLVGRGARYNPLIHKDGFEITRQTFNPNREFYNSRLKYIEGLSEDEKQNHSLILESLHYHTLKEPGYLESLSKSYSLLNIPISSDTEVETFSTSLKEKFKDTYFYKDGYFIENDTYKPEEKDFKTLKDYNIPDKFEVYVTNDTISEKAVFQEQQNNEMYTTTPKVIEDKYIIEAMDRISFYRFNKMKRYMPALYSKKDFVESEQWLNQREKIIYFKHRNTENLTSEMILRGTIEVMIRIAQAITKNYKREQGTKEFYLVPAKNYLPESYSRTYKKRSDIKYRAVKSKWSPYHNMIINGLEEELVNYLENNILNKFTDEKTKVYLIRNDEIKNGLKIYEFGSSRIFYPDFILYIRTDFDDHSEFVQVYIEPKGEHLAKLDKWKENLLITLDEEAKVIIDDEFNQYNILGVRFYTQNNLQEFSDNIKEKISDYIVGEKEESSEVNLFDNSDS